MQVYIIDAEGQPKPTTAKTNNSQNQRQPTLRAVKTNLSRIKRKGERKKMNVKDQELRDEPI
jgi:hypothetical protein